MSLRMQLWICVSVQFEIRIDFPKNTRFVSVHQKKIELIFLDVFHEIGYSL